jgi:hypothetical protein
MRDLQSDGLVNFPEGLPDHFLNDSSDLKSLTGLCDKLLERGIFLRIAFGLLKVMLRSQDIYSIQDYFRRRWLGGLSRGLSTALLRIPKLFNHVFG